MQRIYYAQAGVNGALPSNASLQSTYSSPVYMTQAELNAAEAQYKQYQAATTTAPSTSTSSTSSASSSSSTSSTTAGSSAAAATAGASTATPTATQQQGNQSGSSDQTCTPQQAQQNSGGLFSLLGHAVSGAIGAVLAAIINAINGVLQAVLGTSAPAIIFGLTNSFGNGAPTVGGVFSEAEWNIIRGIVIGEYALVVIAFVWNFAQSEGLGRPLDSQNPAYRGKIYERYMDTIAFALLVAVQLPLEELLFKANYTFTTTLGHAVGVNTDSTLFSKEIFDKCVIPDDFVRALMNLLSTIATLPIMIQFDIRKFLLAIMTIMGPWAAWSVVWQGRKLPQGAPNFIRSLFSHTYNQWLIDLLYYTFMQGFTAMLFALAMVFINPQSQNGGNIAGASQAAMQPVFTTIWNVMFALGGALLVGLLIWKGMKIALSGDNPRERQAARSELTHITIGISCLAGTYFIAPAIINGLFHQTAIKMPDLASVFRTGFPTTPGTMFASANVIIENAVRFLSGIAGAVAFGALILRGYRLMKASNNPRDREEAISGLLWSVAGIAIAVGAGIFANTIAGFVTGAGAHAPSDFRSLQAITMAVIRAASGLIGLISVTVLVVRGLQLASGGGNPRERQRLTVGLMWSCIGIAIAVGAGLFSNTIAGLVGSIAI